MTRTEPGRGFCFLCGQNLDKKDCDCSVQEIICETCGTVMFDGATEPLLGSCDCGKVWQDFVVALQWPLKGFVQRRPTNV